MTKIPEKALAQHLAILGKTGSGKTSTEKLAVEQVVAEGYRVCILDAIKSDWWGITSSADGKKAGLPFKILGGPHGHVPLHSSAGAVIGQLVGSGKLPLSIIDMADFEAGGLQRFFVDFAPALMRSMKGVVYLVIEEAHEFAPKERSGIGAESMAMHWAKKLATAGRSKGIRLIVATQRVQSLHNAVLGSCETLIAHRLTTPADQEPILKWLKANAEKSVVDDVARTMSALPTGTGWICSGEARIFAQFKFPKFKTYDNAATPTKDGAEVQVKTAPVDQDELRLIIGDAVKDAEAHDPKKLRARIVELEKMQQKPSAASDPQALHREYARGKSDGYAEAMKTVAEGIPILINVSKSSAELARKIAEWADRPASVAPSKPQVKAPQLQVRMQNPQVAPSSGPGESMLGGQRKILNVLAQYCSGRSKQQVALLTGYAITGGGFNNNLGALRTRGWIEGYDVLKITELGMSALGSFDPLPSGDELIRHWCGQLDKAPRAIFEALTQAHPKGMTKEDLAAATGYEPKGGGFNNALGRLRTLELIEGYGDLRASDDLFQEAA